MADERGPEPGATREPGGTPETGPGQQQHPLTRAITVAIVLVSLAIAAVGYLQVQASRKSSGAGQEAQRLATLTMSTQLKSQGDAQVDYELFLQSQDQRGRAGNALQQSLFVRGEAAQAYRVEQQLWETLAARTQALTPLTSNSQDGPQNDPHFPRHFFARSTQGALEQQGLEDAANATNSGWESLAARYTAILTLFAVALYLLGFSLALPDRVLRLFGAIGAFLLVVGVGWAIQVTLSAPSTIPAEAATEYAQGEVALETATDAPSSQVAVDHFSRAIYLWPGVSRAYLGRANATLFGSASQVEATLIPPEALERVLSDLSRAQSQGFDNALLLEQLGGTDFSLGLHGQPDRFDAAIDDARAAIEIVPDDPVPRFTLAVSLLAQGDTDGAAAAYTDAMARVLYLQGDPSQPRNSPPFEQPWVSGALSDLEALLAAKPDAAADMNRFKEYVVASFAAGQPAGPSGDASFTGVQAQLTPTTLFWLTGGNTGYDPNSQTLSAEWYFRQSGSAWVAMPEVSGVVDPRVETTAPQYSGRNLVSSSIPARCLKTEQYRVELYVNGHLAGQAETQAQFGALVPFTDRSVNLEVCHPADWTLADSTLPGFRDALHNADGTQGVVLFRYNLTTLPANLQQLDPSVLTDRLLSATVRSNPDLFPAQASPAGDATHQSFQGLEGSTERLFAYDGGVAEGQAGIDAKDQAVFVTFVYGPQEAFNAPGAAQGGLVSVLQSISEYRPGGSSF